jgi:hypothetical protein
MTQKFEMSMMGELTYFLGFQVKQLKDGTFLSQTKYTQDLLKRFGMKDAKPAKTPMGTDEHVDLNKRCKSIDQKAYRSMIVLELALRCKLIQRGSVATQTGFLHEMTIALLI